MTVNSRLFILDKTNNLNFLIDTGADVSVVPPTIFERYKPTDYYIYAANNSKIKTYGVKTIKLNLGLRREFMWNFMIADVTSPIIGADLLRHYGLLVDLKSRKLLDNVTNLSAVCKLTNEEVSSLKTISTDIPVYDLLQEFREITIPRGAPGHDSTVKHDIYHEIITEGTPVVCKPRRLPPDKLEKAKKEFRVLIEQGICRESKSDWANPLHLVPKKDGNFRVTGDYRLLNNKTKKDRTPIPHIHDVTQLCHGKRFMTKLDFSRAYFHVPIDPKDIHKTAITTPFGLFEFITMCPGLCNASATFQRLVNRITQGLEDFVIAFIDDWLIVSRTYEEHLNHLRTVFKLLAQYGLVLNLDKCKFIVHEVEFLGHKINETGVFPLPQKVDAIRNFKRPETQKQLKSFLSTINFYRRFIKNAAQDQLKLNKFLKGKGNSNSPIPWDAESIESFERCKNALIETTYLAHFVNGSEMGLMVDASGHAIGGAVHQLVNGDWQPLAFYSAALSDAQLKYSTYDRELLAAYKSVKHFRHLLEAREFTLFTDHKPLTTAFLQNPDKATPLQSRYLNYISQFTTKIVYVPGKENVTADLLSRISAIRNPTPVDLNDIADSQEDDAELQDLMSQNTTSLKLKRISLPTVRKSIVCDMTENQVRVFVPKKHRYQVFHQYHALAHPGTRSSRHLVSKHYVWPSLNSDIANFVRSCTECQLSKVQRHTKSNYGRFMPPNERFSHVHIDICGPLPTSNENRYILTMVDRFSKWPEAVPLKDQTAASVARAFYENWITRFGVPCKLTTDRGRNFESELFHQLNVVFGITRIHTTSYNPKANGLVERLHRTLKAAIMALIKDTSNWSEVLQTALFGIRTALREDINCTAAEMVYGSTLRLPADFFVEKPKAIASETDFITDLRKIMTKISPAVVNHHSKRRVFIHKDLSTCTHVFVRKDKVKAALEQPYEGPYEVLKRNDKYFEIKFKTRTDTVSIDRLKPAYTLKTDIDQQSPSTVITGSGHRIRYMIQSIESSY